MESRTEALCFMQFLRKIITFRSYFYAFYCSFAVLCVIIHKRRTRLGRGGPASLGGEGQQRRCRRAKLRRSAAVNIRHVPVTSHIHHPAGIVTCRILTDENRSCHLYGRF